MQYINNVHGQYSVKRFVEENAFLFERFAKMIFGREWLMICSIVVLYEPTDNELCNILNYYNQVDYSFILDNSKLSNQDKIDNVLRKVESFHYSYVHFHKNIGLCKALNYGMKEANKRNFDWALLMDSDSEACEHMISLYRNILQNENKNNIAALAPIHIFDRSKHVTYEGMKEISWAMTSGCLYNISIFEKLHGFKEELFVDGLDIDYCYKAREKGYKIIEVGSVQVKHFPAESRIFKVGRKEMFKYGYASPWRYYMQARALVWIILRYKPYGEVVTYLYKWCKVIFLFENKNEFIKQMIKGSKEGICLWNEYKYGN